jgi:hypothetical protein
MSQRIKISPQALVGFCVALLIGLPSLGYPLGGDTAIFDHVGTSWLRGEWPYQDLFDHKPPGIYFVHLILGGLLGTHEVGIRVAELLLVMVMGVLLGHIYSKDKPWETGGMAAAALATLYYTLFDFWATAQTEIWLAASIFAGWAVAARTPMHQTGTFLSGALTGFVLVFKPTAVIPAGAVFVVRIFRLRLRDKTLLPAPLLYHSLSWCTGFLLPLTLFTIAFILMGAGTDIWEAVYVFNRYYANQVHWFEISNMEFWFRQCRVALPLILIAGLFTAYRARATRNHEALLSLGIAIGLLFLAWLSILLQVKQLSYHWSLPAFFMVPLWVGAMALWKHPWNPILCTMAFAFTNLMLFTPPKYHDSTFQQMTMSEHTAHLRAWLSGQISRSEFEHFYRRRYDVSTATRCRNEIVKLAGDQATLCQLGAWNPGIYTHSQFSCPSRFFSDHVLEHMDGNPNVPVSIQDWPTEHHQAMTANPPEFILLDPAFRNMGPQPWFEQHWKEVTRCGENWPLLQRQP